jgi:hypothetical protein
MGFYNDSPIDETVNMDGCKGCRFSRNTAAAALSSVMEQKQRNPSIVVEMTGRKSGYESASDQ